MANSELDDWLIWRTDAVGCSEATRQIMWAKVAQFFNAKVISYGTYECVISMRDGSSQPISLFTAYTVLMLADKYGILFEPGNTGADHRPYVCVGTYVTSDAHVKGARTALYHEDDGVVERWYLTKALFKSALVSEPPSWCLIDNIYIVENIPAGTIAAVYKNAKGQHYVSLMETLEKSYGGK